MKRSLLEQWTQQQAARLIHDECRRQGNLNYARIIEIIRDQLVEYGYADKPPSVRTVKAWLAATPALGEPADGALVRWHRRIGSHMANQLRINLRRELAGKGMYDEKIESLAAKYRVSTRTIKRRLGAEVVTKRR